MLISIGLYSSNFSYISFLGVNFKNLTVEFHVLYILNMHIKFCSNWMLFTIRSINLFFIYIFRLQKLKWTYNRTKFLSNLERNFSNFSYISFFCVNFENLTVKFYVPYILNMHIKFCSNRILFTIWSINLFFIYNFRLQKLEMITFTWWHNNWSLIFLKFCKH